MRNFFARIGFPRQVNKWIDELSVEDVLGKPEDLQGKAESVALWLSDHFAAFHPGGLVSEYMHETVQTLDTIRVPEFETTTVLHPAKSAHFANFKARCFDKNGNPKKVVKRRLRPTWVPDHDGENVLAEGYIVEFQNLAAGDVMDLCYSRDFVKTPPTGPFNWQHTFVNLGMPYCARRRLTFAVHESVEGQVVPHNFDVEPKTWTEHGYRFMQWDLRDVAAFEEEPGQPTPRDSEPWVDVSTCPSWEPISEWLSKHLISKPKSSKQLQDLLQDIAPVDLPLAERAQRCYSFLTEQVAYGRKSGMGAMENAEPGDLVAALQRGDCKDQTSLLRALFSEMGIPSEVAAVTVADPARTTFLPSQRFDHVVLRCEIDGQDVWLDPTAKHCVYGNMPTELEGTPALLIGEDGATRWGEVPSLGVDLNTSSYRAKGHFDGDDLVLEVDMQVAGRFGSYLRRAELFEPGSLKKGFTEVFNERLGSCSVDRFELQDGWKSADPVGLQCQLSASHRVKSAGSMRVFELPWVGAYLSTSSVTGKERTREVVIGGEERVVYELELACPQGTQLAEPPESLVLRGPKHRARIDVQVDGTTLRMNMELLVEGQRIAAEDYPQYRDFVLQLHRFFAEQLVLQPV